MNTDRMFIWCNKCFKLINLHQSRACCRWFWFHSRQNVTPEPWNNTRNTKNNKNRKNSKLKHFLFIQWVGFKWTNEFKWAEINSFIAKGADGFNIYCTFFIFCLYFFTRSFLVIVLQTDRIMWTLQQLNFNNLFLFDLWIILYLSVLQLFLYFHYWMFLLFVHVVVFKLTFH